MTERERDGRSDEEVREQDERTFAGRGTVEDDDTDVVLDVPVLNIEELDLEVEELHAHISARAELAGFLNIAVGVDAHVDKVKLNIKGVEAQLQLKVKLERILGSIDQALRAIKPLDAAAEGLSLAWRPCPVQYNVYLNLPKFLDFFVRNAIFHHINIFFVYFLER